jgi:hypothetical protein
MAVDGLRLLLQAVGNPGENRALTLEIHFPLRTRLPTATLECNTSEGDPRNWEQAENSRYRPASRRRFAADDE